MNDHDDSQGSGRADLATAARRAAAAAVIEGEGQGQVVPEAGTAATGADVVLLLRALADALDGGTTSTRREWRVTALLRGQRVDTGADIPITELSDLRRRVAAHNDLGTSPLVDEREVTTIVGSWRPAPRIEVS